MRIRNVCAAAMSAGSLLLASGAGIAAPATVGLVTELPVAEVYAGHVAYKGRLFVARSRSQDGERHHVDIFDTSTLARRATLDLNHSPSFIQPYGDNAVVVAGRSSTPYWQTHYTIISWTNATDDRYVTRQVTFPDDNQVDHMTAYGTKLYFNEPGSRSVFRLTGTRSLQPFGGEVSGPGPMSADDRDLWVVERRSIQLGDEDLVRLSLDGSRADRVFGAELRQGLVDTLLLGGTPWVATSETLADKVLLVNREDLSLAHEIGVKGGPRGMARLGACLVVASEDPKLVTFVKLTGEPSVIAQWDISAAGDRLKQPRYVAVDPATKRVFVRSSYPCGGCSVTQSSVFYVQDTAGDVFASCLDDRK